MKERGFNMKFLSRFVAIILILGAFFSLNIPAFGQQAVVIRAGECTLNQTNGYDVERRVVVDALKSLYDFSIEYSIDHKMMLISGSKVKSMGRRRPNLQKIDIKKVDKWNSASFISGSGFYYLVKGRKTGKIYLLHVTSITGDSYTASVELKWEELSFGESEKVTKEPNPQIQSETPPVQQPEVPEVKEADQAKSNDKTKVNKVKFCRYCGEKIVNVGTYCEYCGKEIGEKTDAAPETAADAEADKE